jgi:hypothetical protein
LSFVISQFVISFLTMDIHAAALRLLNYRFRSVVEMERKLRDRGFSAEEIAGEIERLTEERWLDDRRFAREYALSKLRARKGAPRGELFARAGGRSDAAVHQRRHEPVQGRLPGREADYTARDDLAEVRPRGRQAQRPREVGPHRAASHVLRDAGQLLVRRLLQEGRDRVRLGAARPNVYGLDPERAWFTVFEGRERPGVPADEEARALWIAAGARPERVLGFGAKDNFWQMGDTGPMRALHRDPLLPRRQDLSKNAAELVNGEGDDTMEIWNLVFMQYDRDASGEAHAAPGPVGRHRRGPRARRGRPAEASTRTTTSICFQALVRRIEALGHHRYGGSWESDQDTAVRVLCDHARAASFLIADGVIPSNEGRGYVLRRIIRRAIRFGRKLPEPVLLTDRSSTTSST